MVVRDVGDLIGIGLRVSVSVRVTLRVRARARVRVGLRDQEGVSGPACAPAL